MTNKSHITHVAVRPEEGAVFRALASPIRRQILDMVRATPGITLGQITEGFRISRFAIRKHVNLLLDATLLTVTRDGTAKRHFLNPIPIQYLYDRWLSQNSSRWAAALTRLQHGIENDQSTMSTLQHRYELYIRASTEKVWQALTDPDMTEKYFHGTRIRAQLEPGGAITYEQGGDPLKVMISGEVLEIESRRKLVHTFDFNKGDGPSRVSYELEAMGEVTRMIVIHDGFEEENDTFRGVGGGWNPIFSGLKTLLETGVPLVIPKREKAG